MATVRKRPDTWPSAHLRPRNTVLPSHLTLPIPGMDSLCARVATRGSLSASAPTLRFAERIARAESAPTAQHLCGPVRLGPGLLNLSHSLHFSQVLIMSAKHGIRLPIAVPFLPFSTVMLKSAAIALPRECIYAGIRTSRMSQWAFFPISLPSPDLSCFLDTKRLLCLRQRFVCRVPTGRIKSWPGV